MELILSNSPQQESTLLTFLFQTSSLQDCKIKYVYYFTGSFFNGTLLWLPQETNTLIFKKEGSHESMNVGIL